jgi:myosin-crossreactive antigen
MKTVKINLYKFEELSEEAKEKAIIEHQDFLDSQPIECENEAGELVDEWHSHSEDETIESIEANEYIFFEDGSLTNCVTYTGKHPKAGKTEMTFKGRIYEI